MTWNFVLPKDEQLCKPSDSYFTVSEGKYGRFNSSWQVTFQNLDTRDPKGAFVPVGGVGNAPVTCPEVSFENAKNNVITGNFNKVDNILYKKAA